MFGLRRFVRNRLRSVGMAWAYAGLFAGIGVGFCLLASQRVPRDITRLSQFFVGSASLFVSLQILSLIAAHRLLQEARARSGAADNPSSTATAAIVGVVLLPSVLFLGLHILARL